MTGQFEIQSEEDVRKLVFSMASRKFSALQRRELALKRDRRKTVPLDGFAEVVDPRQPNPQETVGYEELLTLFEDRLNPDERTLYQQRRRGIPWKTIAKQAQEDPKLLRQRFFRAVKRVALELGIEEEEEFAEIDGE